MIYQDITVIITSFHSGDKIFDCINSISQDVKIIVVENSNDENLKNKIYSKYRNVECILSKENLGYGSANNLALSKTDTNYALIINPDVVLSDNALKNFFLTVKKINSYRINETFMSSDRMKVVFCCSKSFKIRISTKSK